MMDEKKLRQMIDGARVVSFDVFDTLLFRITAWPEAIFALMGQKIGMADFEPFRRKKQQEISETLARAGEAPHADLDQIYAYIAQQDRSRDWEKVKELELEMERDAAFRNEEIYRWYRYALEQGKRVIATSDMYLNGRQIRAMIEACGYTDVAEVNFMTREVTFNGVKAFQIDANGRVYPFFRWFFDLNDSYYSTLDQKTLRPLELRSEISEGKYRTSSKFTYDWKTKQVHTWFRNHKRETATVKTMPLSEVSYDAVALFFNLRCEDANSFKVGEVRTLEMVLSDTIRRINFRLEYIIT